MPTIGTDYGDNVTLGNSSNNSFHGEPVDPETSSPTIELFYTLVVTAFAITLGHMAVRLGAIDPDKGEMVALRWYVGRIAFPLLIFKTVATAQMGSIAWSVGRAQRVLTATCFGFFVVASDDFAIGFPVIQALYPPSMDMDIYIAANALISNALFVPLTMIAFEIGKASKGSTDGDSKDGRRIGICAILRSVLVNPVIGCVIAGFVSKRIIGPTLPRLLSLLISKATSPFGMLALFASGTVLREPKIALWPCLLSLMKVIVCACISYQVGDVVCDSIANLDTRRALQDFAFFYGSIPTSSAPLLFTVQYDPSAVKTVASATLFGIVLAAPVMLMNSIFIETTSAEALAPILHTLSLSISSVSVGSGIVFVVMFACLLLCREWSFKCRGHLSLALYGIFAFAYNFKVLVFDHSEPTSCANGHVVNILQSCSCFLLLSLQIYAPVERLCNCVPEWFACLVSLCLAGLTGLVPWRPKLLTFHVDTCMYANPNIAFVMSIAFNIVMLILVSILSVRNLKAEKRYKAEKKQVEEDHDQVQLHSPDEPTAVQDRPEETWLETPPHTISKALVILALLRYAVALANGLVTKTSVDDLEIDVSGSYAVMLTVEYLLEQGQSMFLLGVLLYGRRFTRHLERVFEEHFHHPDSVQILDFRKLPTEAHKILMSTQIQQADSSDEQGDSTETDE